MVVLPNAQPERIARIFEILAQATQGMTEPMSVLIVRQYGSDPFLVLISCLLSLRARDVITYPICLTLFSIAKTPQELLAVPLPTLEHMLRPIGFYKRKSQILHEVCHELIDRFGGSVPHTEYELRSIKNVGPKTANLVLGEGFGIPALCVDTHVHKVANRLGIVATQTPEQTEEALKKVIPRELWIITNHYFVQLGQNICVPLSPFCSRCPLAAFCPRIGVQKSR